MEELSRAQRAVLIALAGGRSNKAMAWDLTITKATVKAHRTAVSASWVSLTGPRHCLPCDR
ncbi:LuxR C-terminal-related transcriptional regulator [Sphingomonas prati]